MNKTFGYCSRPTVIKKLPKFEPYLKRFDKNDSSFVYEFKMFLQTFPITQLGKITIDLMAFKKDIASQPPPRKTFALTNIAPPLPRSGDYLKDKLIIFSSIICVSCWLKELLGCKSLTHYFSGIYGTSVVRRY